MCGPVAVNLQVMGLETHCVLITWWLVAVLLWSVCSFRMTDAGDVARAITTAPVIDRVPGGDQIWTGVHRPEVGVASPSEYFLHKKAHNRGTKLSSKRRCIPVGRRLQHCPAAGVPCCMLAVGMSVCWLK